MSLSRMLFPRLRTQVLGLSALLAGLAVTGCGGDDNGGGNTGGTGLPASTTYVGLYATNSGVTGALDITFGSAVAAPPVQRSNPGGPFAAGAAPIEANGTVEVNGSPVAITGTLTDKDLAMTGAGDLTITGTLADGVITGTFAAGSESGSITAASSSDGTPARNYCGTFEGTVAGSGDPDLGTFSAVVAGAVINGVAVGDGGTVENFKGTATPSASGGTFTIHQTVGEGTLDVTDGVYNGESTSGTYATKVSGTTVASGSFLGTIGCHQPQ